MAADAITAKEATIPPPSQPVKSSRGSPTDGRWLGRRPAVAFAATSEICGGSRRASTSCGCVPAVPFTPAATLYHAWRLGTGCLGPIEARAVS